MALKKFFALTPFFWDGKNIEVGGSVKLSETDANWMLARGAVSASKPEKSKKATDSK